MVRSDLSQKSDEDLMMELAQSKDHAVFSELVTRHATRFRHIAFRQVHSVDVAEDIVQTAFMGLWQKPESWDGDKKVKFTTWFHRVVVNRSIDHMRKYTPLPMLEGVDFEDDDAERADISVERKQQGMVVEKALRTLPEKMQTALNLGFFDPIPNKDAAEVMEITLKAYQSLVIRAKNGLKDAVEKVMREQRKDNKEKSTQVDEMVDSEEMKEAVWTNKH